MGKGLKVKDIWQAIKKVKNFEIIIAVIVVAVILAIYGSTLIGGDKDPAPKEESAAESAEPVDASTKADNEARLKKVLEAIDGAGRVEVMITYESGPEMVPAMNQSTTTQESEEFTGTDTVRQSRTTDESQNPVVASGQEDDLLVLKEVEPEVRGVIVVAEGASDIQVQLNLQRAVQTVLNVPADKVEVFSMKNKEE
ncbi:hypothetical protein [Gehongia tenuis]|uniref:Stage III sporulation protein AG n=1 Tax=Gehongia tenuis TaxID=2763655 RepID=A0A926D2E7_9FIRM|nr:hypothetical protein [Gehongia tenuis]MBC8531160.1 hypothetical protein [Gehongia tenuis]